MSTVALPPGFYEIHVHTDDGEKKKVLTPQSLGRFVETGTAPESASWQITSDGLIVSFSYSDPYSENNTITEYQTLTGNRPCQAGDKVVTDREGGMRWIVYDVEHIIGDTWFGAIGTNDGSKLFWTIDSSDDSVYLRQYNDSCMDDIPRFHFVPVNPHNGKPLYQYPNGSKFRHGHGADSSEGLGIGRIDVLEAVLILVMINLYVIMQMAKGDRAGRFTDVLPHWLRKDR